MGSPARHLHAVTEVLPKQQKKVVLLHENDMSQPTWLWLCECGKFDGELHGYFRFDGVRSEPFFNKKEGADILEDALNTNLLSLEIAVMFQEAIEGCPLPD